jgi:hypothetical protein
VNQIDPDTRWPWPGFDISVNILKITDEVLDRMTWKGTGWPAWTIRCVARELQTAREQIAQLAHNNDMDTE